MQGQDHDHNHTTRDLIIILITALLIAFFIWRYFDYKIVKLKTDFGYLLEYYFNDGYKNS